MRILPPLSRRPLRQAAPHAAALIAAGLTAPFAAPAFAIDCEKALSEKEKTICSDPELLKLDARINGVYSSLRGKAPAGRFSEIKKRQKELLRASSCPNPQAAKADDASSSRRACAQAMKRAMRENLVALMAEGAAEPWGAWEFLFELESTSDLAANPTRRLIAQSAPNPELVYYGKTMAFFDLFWPRLTLPGPLSKNAGRVLGIGRQAHNATAAAFFWADPSTKTMVLAVAEEATGGGAGCRKGGDRFYAVADRKAGKPPAEAVAALREWIKADSPCAADAKLFDQTTGVWRPFVEVGAADDAAKETNQALGKSKACQAVKAPFDRALCASPDLRDDADAFDKNAAAVRASLQPASLREAADKIMAARKQDLAACASDGTPDQQASCMRRWYREVGSDLAAKLQIEGAGAQHPRVALREWTAALDAEKNANRATVSAHLAKAAAGFRMALPSEKPILLLELKTERARVLGEDWTTVTAHYQVGQVYGATPEAAWTWIGFFKPEKDGAAVLRFFVQHFSDGDTCGSEPTLALAPTTDQTIAFDELLVASCGSSVDYGHRRWRCARHGTRFACLAERRKD